MNFQYRAATASWNAAFSLTLACVGLFGTLLSKGRCLAQPTASGVEYSISFEDADKHYVYVTAKFPDVAENQRIFLPVWTPGSYLVREYSRHIDSVAATSSDGTAIAIAKVSKNQWQLEADKGSIAEVRYRIYCNELSVRTNFVDATFALLNGAAVFLTADQYTKLPHKVTLELPSNWQQAVTSLERRVSDGPNVFVAGTYDELVDSPFVVGNPRLHPFEVGGVQHWLVNVGGDGLWDGDKASADVAKIVNAHQEMWGQVPYNRYYFLNVIAESGGGLEHDNSTVMLTSRWSFRDASRYQRWLGLVSHEFFHTWNVRRLRPKQLAEYQYGVENYFEELWVAEGVTSYYDDLALARSGLVSATDYLGAISRQIKSLQSTHGRLNQSLAESSYDAWIKHYRPNENSRNTTISYYTKGAVVGFLLDIEIRRVTKNKHSLDDVMRKLYDDYALKSGYTTEDVKSCVAELTGTEWDEWFHAAIFSTEELEYEPALQWLGLTFNDQKNSESEDQSSASEEAKQENEKQQDGEDLPKGELWTGMSTRSSGGKVTISAVTEGSPAYKAGINVDDELIAINNFRVEESESRILGQFEDAISVDLLIARRGALKTVALPIQRREPETWQLKIRTDVNEKQLESLTSWLRQNPKPEKAEGKADSKQ